MRDRLTDPPTRHDVVTIPIIWVAIVLSLLVHLAVLWVWKPEILFPSAEGPDRGEATGSLQVRLAPPPAPKPAPPPPPAVQALPSPPTSSRPTPPPQARPSPAPRPAPQARPPRAPAPPVIALNKPAAKTPTPGPATPPVPAPTPAPAPADDFASFIDAKRRARAEPPPPSPPPSSATEQAPVEDDAARSNRIVAANLGAQRAQTFGYDPSRGGGIFQIKRLGYDDAEFMFYGWNRDIRKNTAQLIEVRRGNNGDIRIAVVRKIIAIIRDYEKEEFLWESKRLGRNLTLSARAKDNAGLEEFMMREFFDARMP